MIGIVHTPKKQTDSRNYNPISLLLVVSVIIFSLGIAFNMASSARKSEVEYVIQDIEPGDTVWSIVREVYGDEAEIRGVVKDTLEMNGLTEGIIHPGTTIRIPKPSNIESAEATKKI